MRSTAGAFVITFALVAAAASASAASSSPQPEGAVVRVAVAANFATPFAAIAHAFEPAAGARIDISIGATGALYAQISHGAPFDLFVAADTLHPALLEQSGDGVLGTRVTYAVGQLVLWSSDPRRIGPDGAAALTAAGVRKVAIANPKTAPYGRAAEQTMRRLGVWDSLQAKLVFGENVGQTLRFVDSGAAQLGFVARAQILDPRLGGRGSTWVVPDSLYEPLRQDAVLLAHGRENAAAHGLLEFLRGREALAVLERFGYGLP